MRPAAGVLFCLAALGEQLPVRVYTTAEGLAGNTIDRIVRDSRGYLWFCTREGISRFDGYRFQNFGIEQGLPVLDTDMVETPAGDYWIATGDGIARFRPSDPHPHFTMFRPADPQAHRIEALAADPSGGVWAGTTAGLYHLDPPQPSATGCCLRPVDIGLPGQNFGDRSVEVLLVDRSGTLWIGARSGLYRRFADGHSERTVGGPPYPDVRALVEDRDGRLWAGTERGVCRILPGASLAGRRFPEVCAAVPGLDGVVHFLHQSADGRLWAGSNGLLSAWVPEKPDVVHYNARNGLPGEGTEMLAAAEDLAGNLWVGGFGAIRIAKGGFRTYSEQDGLDSGFIGSIFEDRAGNLCVVSAGANGRIVNRFGSGRFHPVRPGVPRGTAWGWGAGQIMLQTRSREWWIPTAAGVFRFPPPADFQKLARTAPLAAYEAPNSVYAIFEDSGGGVWISSQILAAANGPTKANGLARWDPATGILRHYSESDGVPSQGLATAFAEDRAGAVWIALSTGSLLRYANGNFRTLPPPAGRETWVNALQTDHLGRLWVGTKYGATVVDPAAPKWRPATYTTADGLATNDVKSIVEDLQGRIYLATGHGVDRLSFSAGGPLRIRHYTTEDGLARGELRAAFRDRAGVLWFGTREGLSRLEPEVERPAAPPPVFVTGLRVRGTPRPVPALGESDLRGIQLTTDQNQVELEFVSLRFGAGETLRYRYRLESRDADWSAPTEERTVTYANLAPGDYRWQVLALNADGVASARPASVAFTILPPIWQRWWLRLMALMVACAILYTLYRYRLSRLLEMERLRTRIATDLHDDIGSTLSQIAILSEVAQRRPAGDAYGEPLEDIAGLSRELVDSMSDIVWAIDPEQDRLDDLTHRMRRFAGDLFSYNGVRVRFHAPGSEPNVHIDADIRRQVFLIFKEGLHNIARHSASNEVDIRLRLAGGWLELDLIDNGRGFDPAGVRRGHGLASMAQRAGQLGGTLAVEAAPAKGAALQLRVPLARRSAAWWKTIPHKWIGSPPWFRLMLKDRKH